MSAAGIALLVGMFLAPALMLGVGHRLRKRSPAVRGAFWGAVIGHSLAMLAMLGASLYPPVGWTEGASGRTVAVFWSLLLGAVLGGLLGAALARRRGARR